VLQILKGFQRLKAVKTIVASLLIHNSPYSIFTTLAKMVVASLINLLVVNNYLALKIFFMLKPSTQIG